MKKKLGRPTILKSKRKVKLSVTISPEVKKKLDALPEGNSELVEEALRSYFDWNPKTN